MPLKKEIFYVAGAHYYLDNIKRLACANPDWRLTAAQIIAKGKADERIYRYSYISKPVKLIPEPDNPHDRNAVMVVIAGELVGYIDSDKAFHVLDILRRCDVKYISAHITGGDSKVIARNGEIFREASEHITIKMIVGYSEDSSMSQYDDYDYDDYSYDSTDYYDVGRSARRRAPGGGRPPKKPIYKKWWFWLIIVLLLGSIGNAVNGGDTSSDVTVSEPMDASVPEDTANPEDVFGFNITFYNSFRNDVTGRWRSALVSTAAHIEDYALDYYNAYFESDDEVHFIYNLGLGIENCLTVGSGVLYVTVREYVDGEEHDAKEAGTGMVLGKYQISMDTGEVESIPLD